MASKNKMFISLTENADLGPSNDYAENPEQNQTPEQQKQISEDYKLKYENSISKIQTLKDVINEYDQFKTEALEYQNDFPEEQAFLHHDASMQFFDDDYQMQSNDFND